MSTASKLSNSKLTRAVALSLMGWLEKDESMHD